MLGYERVSWSIMMKRSVFLPFFLPGCIRVGGLKERRRVSHHVYLPRFFADRGRKGALSHAAPGESRRTTLLVHSGCTVHRVHSRRICGRRVEYVPGYVRRPRIPSAVFLARNVATSLSLREDDIFPSSVLPHSRVVAADFASTSRCIRDGFAALNAGCHTRANVTDRVVCRNDSGADRRMQLCLKMFFPEIDTFADTNSYSSHHALMT